MHHHSPGELEAQGVLVLDACRVDSSLRGSRATARRATARRVIKGPSLPFGKLLFVSVKPSSVVDQVFFPLVKKKTDLAFQPFTTAWIGGFQALGGRRQSSQLCFVRAIT